MFRTDQALFLSRKSDNLTGLLMYAASYMKGYDFSPPPFLTLVESPDTFLLQIIRGANFASGGSGILRDTGREKFVSVSHNYMHMRINRSFLKKKLWFYVVYNLYISIWNFIHIIEKPCILMGVVHSSNIMF